MHDDTLLVARAHGPEVLPGNVDIFEWYVDESATKVGFNNVLQCEEEIYHVGQGSIHCGTNVLRLIPDDDTDKWWNNF